MAIPPESQIPFDPNREYGQEPGFVSRHSGKIVIVTVILTLLLVAFFWLTVLMSNDDDYSGWLPIPSPEVYTT